MFFLEFIFCCIEIMQFCYENVLDDVGVLVVILFDVDVDISNEQVILEFGVGEILLWNDLVLIVLFLVDINVLVLLVVLDVFDLGLDWGNVSFCVVQDEDWECVWLDQFQLMVFGECIWIVFWNYDLFEVVQVDDVVVVWLDLGLVFGLGIYLIIVLCLCWFDGLVVEGVLDGQIVFDFGCGLGILVLVVLKFGVVCVVGVDNDLQVVIVIGDNVECNGFQDCIVVYLLVDELLVIYLVVVVNILVLVLDVLVEVLVVCVVFGGCIVLLGILYGQEGELLECYVLWFEVLEVVQDEDWMCIIGICCV